MDEELLSVQITKGMREVIIDALYMYDNSLCCAPLEKAAWVVKTRNTTMAALKIVMNAEEAAI